MSARHQTPESRGRITPPARRTTASSGDSSLTFDDIPAVLQPPQSKKPAAKPSPSTQGSTPAIPPRRSVNTASLAGQRRSFGFDDIPVASAQEKDRRKRAGNWAKGAYERSLPAEKRQRLGRFFKTKGPMQWKEDLKWAISADRETDSKNDLPARRKQANTPKAVTTPSPEPTAKTIDINISFGSLPKFTFIKKLASDIRHLRWNRATKVIVVLAVAVLLLVAVPFLAPTITSVLPANNTSSPVADEKPDYKIMLPDSKPADSVSWQRVSPVDRDPVYAYNDTIDTVKISVSQQPIPNDFKPNVASSVETLAKNYAATNKIAADSVQLFVGTSGNGPQSVIFTKNGLLVLIMSASKITDKSWVSYVDSLQFSQTY